MLVEERSYEKITSEDLRELQRIALEEGKSFFYRNPHLREAYWDSLITIALCQGAAKHFLDGKTGVKDFDIWYFYEKDPNVRFPYRWRKPLDSKLAKFGVHPDDAPKRYRGRRIDLLGRAIVAHNKRDPKRCIIEYLEAGRTKTAKELLKKPVIGLWPEAILSKIIWPCRL